MNSNEAMRRMAKIIRWIGAGAVVPIFFIGGLMIHYEVGDSFAIGAAVIAVAAFFFFAARAIAWVIEGAAKEKN